MKKLIPLIAALLIIHGAQAQSVAQTRCNNFGKGMNLSNWLESYWRTDWPDTTTYTKTDLVKMKDAGIQSLRLPVCFAMITDTLAPYYVDTNSRVFAIVDSVIQWSADLDMNLIIDNHHQWDIFNQNWRTKQPRFTHLWSVLAQRYQHLDPDRYTLELLNEPAFGIDIDSLNEVFRITIDTIRQYTTQHTIIVSPNFSGNGQAFNNRYIPFADSNLIYTWHSYDPYQFTHQGFAWASPPTPLGVTFPSYISTTEKAWHDVVHWSDTFHLPVFLGEFGTGVLADANSRCNWIEYFGAKIDSFNMPWFYWDWKYDFSMFNSSTVSHDSIMPCFSHALRLYGEEPTGINNVAAPFGLQLMPNPANNNAPCILVTDAIGNSELQLFDITGRAIYRQTFTRQCTLPLYTFATGMYFVQVSNNGKTETRKLLVE